MTDAEKLYNETYASWMYAWSAIHNFRNAFKGVSDTVARQLSAQTESLFRSLIEDPQWKGILTDEGQQAEAFDSKLLARTSAAALMTAHYGSLDAATLEAIS